MTKDKDQAPKDIKVLLTGVQNAGKTSILTSLSGNREELETIKPTRGAKVKEYKFLGMNIMQWDLGGQKIYRKAYLNKQPEQIFGNVSIIIHVIDIQDQKRIDESMEYLVDIFEQIKILNIEPILYVFFHKYDPISMINSQNELNNFSLQVRNIIKKLLVYRKMQFFRTSIYDFQTINIPMAKVLLSKIPKSQIIDKSIEEYAVKQEYSALELIDENSLILGSFYSSKYNKELMNSVTPFFLEVNDIFEKVKFSQPYKDEREDEMMIRKFGRYFIFKKFILRDGGSNFYFLGSKQDSGFKIENFSKFIAIIEEILAHIL